MGVSVDDKVEMICLDVQCTDVVDDVELMSFDVERCAVWQMADFSVLVDVSSYKGGVFVERPVIVEGSVRTDIACVDHVIRGGQEGFEFRSNQVVGI